MKIILSILFLVPNLLFAQTPSFIRQFSGETNKESTEMIELPNRDLVMISKENTSTTNTKIQSRMYLLSENGRLKDSLVFADSVKSLSIYKIVPTHYGYCVLGEMKENNFTYFWNAKLNAQFNIISQQFTLTNASHLILMNYTLAKDSQIIVIIPLYLAIERRFSYNSAKINKRGELISFYNRALQSTLPTNIFEKKDSSGYLMLDNNGWTVTDTAFNIKNERSVQTIRGIHGLINVQSTGLRKNDSTYFYAGRWVGRNDRFNRDLFFMVIDTLGQIKYFRTIEAGGDTSCTQGVWTSIDTTKDRRFIYWGGTYGVSFLEPTFSLRQAPFILTKLDTAYNIVWQKKYGGDAYNLMFGVLATSDGGCVMYGRRYDYNNVPKTDAYIIKVDGNGVVTSETTIPITQTSITAYPNPSMGQLNFKKEAPSVFERFDVLVFDISGKLVFEKKETDLSEMIDLTYLTEGNYMYQIQQQGVVKNIGKWVKVK